MKYFLLIPLLLILNSSLNAQILKDWELFGGFNVSNQKLIMRNQSMNTSPISGWQLGLTKNIHIRDYLKWEVSGGYTTNGSAYTRENNFPDYNEVKRIDFSYVYLETGMKFIKNLKQFNIFTGAAFRGGILTKEKVNDIFYHFIVPYHEKFDYGVNFKVGTGYKLSQITPFLQLTYYAGMANITPQSILVGPPPGTIFSNKMINRSLSIQGGIRF